jgi:hypothetical protein
VNLLSIFGVEVPALKMEVILFSEILVTTYKTMWCHNPEDHFPEMQYIFSTNISVEIEQ